MPGYKYVYFQNLNLLSKIKNLKFKFNISKIQNLKFKFGSSRAGKGGGCIIPEIQMFENHKLADHSMMK